MRKLTFWLSVVAVMAIVLTGCAAPAGTTGAAEPAATEAAPAEAAATRRPLRTHGRRGRKLRLRRSSSSPSKPSTPRPSSSPSASRTSRSRPRWHSLLRHQRRRLSGSHGRRRRSAEPAQWHRPVQSGRVAQGRPDDLQGNPDYLGREGHRRERRSSAGAPKAHSACSNCSPAQSMASTTPVRTTSRRSRTIQTCNCRCAAAPTSSISA